MSILVISPRKWRDPVTRSSYQRVKLIGDILQDQFRVIYLVAYENGYSPPNAKNTKYCSPFRYKGKFIYPLSDFNVLLLWQIRKCVKRYKPRSLWFSGPFGIISTKLMFPNLKIVYLSHDVLSDTPEIIAPKIRDSFSLLQLLPGGLVKLGLKMSFFFIEKISCRISDFVLTQGESDKRRYIQLYAVPSQKVISAPTPIDKTLKPYLEKVNASNKSITVVFHGTYSYLPNKEAVDFIVEHMAPYLQSRDPSIHFLLAGTDMPEIQGPNFKVIGFVEDLNSFLESADIAIIPITKGTGLRTKALDYMASGVPIIATRIGVGGIDVKDGVHVMIVENLKEMAQAIIDLSHDEHKRKELARNAWQFVMAEYSMAAIKERLKAVSLAIV